MTMHKPANKQRVGLATTLDIVFVIDATASMQKLLDEVKNNALTLHPRIMEALAAKRRSVLATRIRVVVYRDLYVDSEAIAASDFFTLPDEAEQFRRFVENVRACGGGDEPESGLEALHTAIISDWNMDPRAVRRRQIIIVMTDASAHPLDDPQRAVDSGYPRDMPKSMAELYEEWESQNYIDSRGKRLALFAPNKAPWQHLSGWSACVLKPCAAGKGLPPSVLDEVIDYIAGSL